MKRNVPLTLAQARKLYRITRGAIEAGGDAWSARYLLTTRRALIVLEDAFGYKKLHGVDP